ncbi:MAG TPA: pyridoxamine 5'-phosphate oxidase [Candidatus Binatia bacterium]|nr:pyridoxamine 5'-phosphate oxidase [Candidatus Binatia bacterium]
MQYDKNPPLDDQLLAADPLEQLQRWLADASAAGQIEPTAMTLATVGAEGRPSARVVLFKGLHEGQLTFYTNYESRKGAELARLPHAALVFWWDRLERQVRVEGEVTKLPPAMSERYFLSRPRLSQLAALTSRQSRPLADRAELDARLAANERKHEGHDVPCPPFWGGYGLRPALFEFWQGRRGRLHDRVVYRRGQGDWTRVRLEP